uniref:CS domain-containing protein n=1 Tax=Fibrocapsa japonica TaxID=94617 RepID=A0A7S2V6G0_9STRA|eukprot:CAMPEP_0113936872 /NCGR_PEP_ID=MMETSP1339-20121228/3635_1 /TAXON_ID=94617 /ORGANISM="Fibrocapsa japonica" /LENGTH=223 /DNA_ID=CAMNT_0000939441 /DNA_START=17 /DNA_END=688 /DNA_ORIENTATION=+ /assembly_acc=CAM_ASM_000762
MIVKSLSTILLVLTWLPREAESWNFPHSLSLKISQKRAFSNRVTSRAGDIDDLEEYKRIIDPSSGIELTSSPAGQKEKTDKEAIFKRQIEELSSFPYDPFLFPELRDSTKYWRGATQEYKWEQNHNKVCIYIPVDETVDKSDVDVEFEVHRLLLKLGGRDTKVGGLLGGTIKPEDSYWFWESDSSPPFITIELQKFKQYRNWEFLFAPSDDDTDEDDVSTSGA